LHFGNYFNLPSNHYNLFVSCFFCPYLPLCPFQVWIFGEKVGEGTGKTRKEAQQQAADTSLRNLAGE
jgi:hypothetical protein